MDFLENLSSYAIKDTYHEFRFMIQFQSPVYLELKWCVDGVALF